mgnify:CR=1 FL=1
MDGQQIGVIALVKSALTGEKAEISENFDWDNALNTAKKHQIIPMLYYGVQYSGITPPAEIMQFLELATFKNISVSQNQLYALEQIYKAFDENEIDYMPLKGSVLKFVYPKPEMRPMGDADILIRQEQYEKIRILMQKSGFTEGRESSYDYAWDKPSTLHLELHKHLVPVNYKDFYSYYDNPWRLAHNVKNNRYILNDEDNYIFIFTHYAKHYRARGVGIRHILDIYVFLSQNKNMNFSYIDKELEKMGLLKFYKNTIHTINVWFGEEHADTISDFITNKIFSSGSFGKNEYLNISNAVITSKSAESLRGIKFKQLFNMIFLPYSNMCILYPCLKKIPVLLPIFWVVRAVYAVFNKRKRIGYHIKNLKSLTDNEISQYQDDLTYVGLDFNFKE